MTHWANFWWFKNAILQHLPSELKSNPSRMFSLAAFWELQVDWF